MFVVGSLTLCGQQLKPEAHVPHSKLMSARNYEE
jgi:hypothetical protein